MQILLRTQQKVKIHMSMKVQTKKLLQIKIYFESNLKILFVLDYLNFSELKLCDVSKSFCSVPFFN